ncbi:dentin sialophosphoprotein-like [Mercenaria mercenaria]|uniref:dentin sialophosphoprotein-like n=1 Tax=Mercenaria mercenaria TaxID=6596 RepID=UPI00234E3739|nr:dentin sialophosphoprotein-like [Mercenaria mercenaria]
MVGINEESEESGIDDEITSMLKTPITPIVTPERKVVSKSFQMELEDVSEEELDFSEGTPCQDEIDPRLNRSKTDKKKETGSETFSSDSESTCSTSSESSSDDTSETSESSKSREKEDRDNKIEHIKSNGSSKSSKLTSEKNTGNHPESSKSDKAQTKGCKNGSTENSKENDDKNTEKKKTTLMRIRKGRRIKRIGKEKIHRGKIKFKCNGTNSERKITKVLPDKQRKEITR